MSNRQVEKRDWSTSLESMRFGYRIARASWNSWSASVIKEISDFDAEIAIVRFPASEWPIFLNSFELANIKHRFADEIVYYSLSLPKEGIVLRKDLSIVQDPVDCDVSSYSEMLTSAFKGYQNHYSANPLFLREKIEQGFHEWGMSFLSQAEGQHLWIAKASDGKIVGFLGGRRVGEAVFDIVLNAVHPDFRKTGIYSGLLMRVASDLEQSHKSLIISTQTHNISVQRVWQKNGFRIDSCFCTVHLDLRKT